MNAKHPDPGKQPAAAEDSASSKKAGKKDAGKGGKGAKGRPDSKTSSKKAEAGRASASRSQQSKEEATEEAAEKKKEEAASKSHNPLDDVESVIEDTDAEDFTAQISHMRGAPLPAELVEQAGGQLLASMPSTSRDGTQGEVAAISNASAKKTAF